MKVLPLILFFLLLVPLSAMAVPSVKTIISSGAQGLDLKVPLFEAIKLGTNLDFYIHAYNKDNGLAVTNANCSLHLYNSSGAHTFEGSDATVSHLYDYEIEIPSTAFPVTGEYQYIAYCNATVQVEQTPGGTISNVNRGGYYSATVTVNSVGQSDIENTGIVSIIAFGIMIMLFAYLYAQSTLDWMRILYLSMSMFSSLMMLSSLMDILDLNGILIGSSTGAAALSAYTVQIYVIWALLAIITIYLIYSSLKSITGEKEGGGIF